MGLFTLHKCTIAVSHARIGGLFKVKTLFWTSSSYFRVPSRPSYINLNYIKVINSVFTWLDEDDASFHPKYWIQELAVHFLKTNPGSKPPRGSRDCKRNFKWQLPKGLVRPSEAPQAAMRGRALRLGWAGWLSAAARIVMGSFRLGNCTVGNLPLGKIPLGSGRFGKILNILLCDLPYKDANSQFTTVPLKSLSDQ